MNVTLIDIEEADYGCEECPPEGPHAILVLKDSDGNISRKEVSERWISERRLKPGDHVTDTEK